MSVRRRTPAEERLFNLVLALLATTQGLTKAEILSTVQGYAQRYESGADNTSLARQFERDKDGIRALGVPLETVEDPSSSTDNQLQRYRIPPSAYELPSDVTFSAEEITLLELAARVWRSGSLSDDSRRALLKLRSFGAHDLDGIVGLAPRITTRHRAFEPLSEAVGRRTIVEFSYLKPGSDGPRLRRVAPLALVQHESRWHLGAYDYGVEAPRTFLLERMLGAVTDTGTAVEPWVLAEHGTDSDEVRRQLNDLWSSHVAMLAVVDDTDAAVKLGRRSAGAPAASGHRLQVHYTDRDTFADELASYGAEVTVLEPDDLRRGVIRRLRQIRDAHEEASA